MDLLSTVRKSGSRGGVNFNWNDVASSTHRENYLGHSLKAPVGRWQQGKDLTWYSKSGANPNAETDEDSNETEEERQARQRREEIRRVKEAEEDAMNAALGLPPPVRNTTGANAIEVGGAKKEPQGEEVEVKAKVNREDDGGRREGERERKRDRRHERRHRSRSRSRDRERDSGRRRDRDRDGSRERRPRRYRDEPRERQRSRSRERGARRPERRDRNCSRSRSPRGRRDRSRSRDTSRDKYRRHSTDRSRVRRWRD